MAIVTFKEISDGRDGGEEITGKKALRRYTRVFRAVTDSNDDEAASVLLHPDCPRIGSQYPFDLYAYCRRVRPRNDGPGKRVWIITAGYSTEREMEEDPVNDPVKVNWGTEQFQQPVWKDNAGKAIVSSSGEMFDPPAEKDDSRITATITGNFSLVPDWIFTFQDAVNEREFVLDGITVPAGVAKISSISVSEEQRRDEIFFRTVTIQMHFRRPLEGNMYVDVGKPQAGHEWDLWIMDAGFKHYDSGGDLIDIKTPKNDEPVTAPWPLNGHGTMIEKPTVDNWVFLAFAVYPKEDFVLLPGCSAVV